MVLRTCDHRLAFPGPALDGVLGLQVYGEYQKVDEFSMDSLFPSWMLPRLPPALSSQLCLRVTCSARYTSVLSRLPVIVPLSNPFLSCPFGLLSRSRSNEGDKCSYRGGEDGLGERRSRFVIGERESEFDREGSGRYDSSFSGRLES